jgi:hypothetical protein
MSRDEEFISIDPLDNVKASRRQIQMESIVDKSGGKVSYPNYTLAHALDDSSSLFNGTTVLSLSHSLLLLEAERLQTFPLEVLVSFREIMEQIVPRASFMSFIIHIMLLIPTIQYLKLHFHISIIPFLYLGPLVFIIPYISYFFWETSILELNIINLYLLNYIKRQNDLAQIKLADESNRIETILSSEFLQNSNLQENTLARKLVFLRLFSKIDPVVLQDEVLALKRSGFSKEKQNLLSTSVQTFDIDSKTLAQSKLDSLYSGEYKKSVESINLVEAAKDLIDIASIEGSSKEELIKSLKEMKEALKSNKNISK